MANPIGLKTQTLHRIGFGVWTLRASFRSVEKDAICNVFGGCAGQPSDALRAVREAFKTERGNLSKMQHHPFNVERSDRSGMHGREGSDSGCGTPAMPWGESFNLERSDRSMLKGSSFILERFAVLRVNCAAGARNTQQPEKPPRQSGFVVPGFGERCAPSQRTATVGWAGWAKL